MTLPTSVKSMLACGQFNATKRACENTAECASGLLVRFAGPMTLLLYLDLFHLSDVCLARRFSMLNTLHVLDSSQWYAQAIDATDDSEEPGSSHVKNPSQASLATSTTGALLT